MRNFTHIFLYLLIAFVVSSCTSSRELIGKSQTVYGQIKFYAVHAEKNKGSISKVYAKADSNTVKKYYSFYHDIIVMTDERAKQLSYRVLFSNLPDHFDSNIYNQFSSLDTLVFSKARTLLKTPRYSHLKSPERATGFEIEVYYMHGFPKNRKFQPL